MASDRGDKSQGRFFCWEQISRTHRLFRVSRVFAPAGQTDRLLPLYALFSVVEQICSNPSDETVAGSRLAWWRNELEPVNMPASQHPLVQELVQSGAAERLPEAQVRSLFAGAAERLNGRSPAGSAELERLCVSVYKPQLAMELSISGVPGSTDEFDEGLMARNGLFQLVRESAQRNEQSGYWWVPLNSLARHGVTRDVIAGAPGDKDVAALFAELFAEALGWGGQPVRNGSGQATDFSLARHVFAISALMARKLQRLASTQPARFSRELARLGPADLLQAWSGARRGINHR